MPKTATSHHSQLPQLTTWPCLQCSVELLGLFYFTTHRTSALPLHHTQVLPTDIHRNRCNSLLSRQNSIKSNNYTKTISYSLSAVTDRNTGNGRCTSISPRKAKEDWAQTYSTSESLTSICSIRLLQTCMTTTQKLT